MEYSIPFNRPQSSKRNKATKRKVIPGWTELVLPQKNEENVRYQLWLSDNKPKEGYIYWNMRLSRSNFKQAKKKCVNAAELIKRDKFTEACLIGDKNMFEELKKMKGKSNLTSTKIDGKNSPEDIADHFAATYRELFNRTESNENMINLFNEVDDKISNDDFKDIDKVTSKLVHNILKEKIKPNKTDPEFQITTDCFKNG